MTQRVWKASGLPKGPGSDAFPYTDSPGVLAYAVHYMLTCDNHSSDTATGRVPFDRIVPTACPSLVVASNEMDTTFIEPVWAMFSLFSAAGQDGSLQSYHDTASARLASLTDEFGTGGPNLDALDAIDLSGLPSIFGAFRAEYYAIFQYHQPFHPSRYLAGADGSDGNSWNQSLVQRMHEIFESGDGPAHQLERWWVHASLSVALPAVEALVARERPPRSN